MKKKKTIIISIIAAIVVAIIVVIISKKKKITKEIEANEKGTDTNVTSLVTPSPYLIINASFPLDYGSKGKQVAHVQKWLNAGVINPPYVVNYPKLIVDGILGEKTKAAIIKAGYTLPISQEFYNTKINQKYKL